MARVMKSFNTEAEFEEWVNSPDMRTPYTCSIKENGNVHFFDGDDEDYSITFVARRHAWFKIWSPSVYKKGLDGKGFNPKVYVNGEEVGKYDSRWEQKSHFRAYIRRDENYNPITNDCGYEHNTWINNEHAFERDSFLIPNPNNGEVNLLYHRKHVFRNKKSRPNCCIFLNKGDVCKIVFERPTILSYKIGGSNSNLNSSQPVQVHLFDICQILRYADYTEEVIIGDGFDRMPQINRVRKLFLGKNVKENANVVARGKDYKKSKIFSRKELTRFDYDMKFEKNSHPDIY